MGRIGVTTAEPVSLSPEVPTDKSLIAGVMSFLGAFNSAGSPLVVAHREVMHSLAHNPFTVARLVRRMPRRRPPREPICPSFGAVLIHREGEQ